MSFDIISSYLVYVPAVAFVVTIFLKWIFIFIRTGKIHLCRALWSWGMPSVHSSVVVSLSTAIALKHWISSDLFAISIAFTVIIIYDAINVRYEAWQHAAHINEILWEKKFKESLGHLPSEVLAGSIVWIWVALGLYSF